MSKESFKEFVKKHPGLANYVNNNSMTWQKFYDMYDLYGESNDIWNKYFTDISSPNVKIDNIKELLQMVRNVDLDSVQKSISGMQKAIGLIQDLGIGKASSDSSDDRYEPRPMYKYFED